MDYLRYILIIFVNILVLEAKKKYTLFNYYQGQGLSPSDPSSFSRPEECVVTNIHLSLNFDFTNQYVYGIVNLIVRKQNPSVTKLILDSRDLQIFLVEMLHESGNTSTYLNYEVSPEVEHFGSKLSISLPQTSAVVLHVRINYQTSPYPKGLQWFKASQTLDKEMPFVVTQFQYINARSVLPLQDTPSVKAPYTAYITVPKGMTVVMSAIRVGEPVVQSDNRVRYKFEQKNPIPSYLIAIGAGKLVSQKIGPRSHIWAEPSMIKKAAYEFAETDQMLKTAEDICGPYIWEIYDLLIPPAFPFGGMENPCTTFLSPTLITGDRSQAFIIAHEIAHSWSGNLVTNKNYEHIWLNEGFSVFIARKIEGRMKGRKRQDVEASKGAAHLGRKIKELGETNPLTKLVLDLRGINTIDLVSLIPYEKGSLFLRYLEDVVGGPEKFEPFLKDYFNKYKYKSIDTSDFQNFFKSTFYNIEDIKTIDWNRWLNIPGMPPKNHKTAANAVVGKYMTVANADVGLKYKWAHWDCKTQDVFSPNDLKDMGANQISHFLQLIYKLDPMPICKLREMEKLYKLNSYNQQNIRLWWIKIKKKAHWALRMMTLGIWFPEVRRAFVSRFI